MEDYDATYDSGEESTESTTAGESNSNGTIESGDGIPADSTIEVGTDEIEIPDEGDQGGIPLPSGSSEGQIDISGAIHPESDFMPIGDYVAPEQNEIPATDGVKPEGVIPVETPETAETDATTKNPEEKTDINEQNKNLETEPETETQEVAEIELAEYLEKESPYSPEVNAYISSPEELQVYMEAGLVEKEVNGRICLIREDLDLDYYDPQSEMTNAELIAKGRAPFDSKTGERIELHHIGQKFDAPLAELKAVSEHDLHTKTLHKSHQDSWRQDPEKEKAYNTQRKEHWKNRSTEESE